MISVIAIVLFIVFAEKFRPAREAVSRGIGELSGTRMEVEVHVLAKQFSWHFHYPGADGSFGRKSMSGITDDNPVGIDFSDPAAADDRVLGELVLPCDTEVLLVIDSADVIHALGDLEGSFHSDAIAGVSARKNLKTPLEPRTGRLRCKQLCGSGHANHHAPYRFLERSDYVEW